MRIGKFLVSTNVNGPGRRFVIWFQGCPLRCSGCFNPEFWNEEGGLFMSVKEMMPHINSAQDIEGVTFTGGEPLIQAKSIIPLASAIKLNGLSIVCYTGYLYQEILADKVPYGKELLKFVDILIDGLYVEEEKASLLWRGSRNQKVYFLTDRYEDFETLVLKEGIREVELKVGENELVMTGIFDTEIWKRLKKKVNQNEHA